MKTPKTGMRRRVRARRTDEKHWETSAATKDSPCRPCRCRPGKTAAPCRPSLPCRASTSFISTGMACCPRWRLARPAVRPSPLPLRLAESLLTIRWFPVRQAVQQPASSTRLRQHQRASTAAASAAGDSAKNGAVSRPASLGLRFSPRSRALFRSTAHGSGRVAG